MKKVNIVYRGVELEIGATPIKTIDHGATLYIPTSETEELYFSSSRKEEEIISEVYVFVNGVLINNLLDRDTLLDIYDEVLREGRNKWGKKF